MDDQISILTQQIQSKQNDIRKLESGEDNSTTVYEMIC